MVKADTLMKDRAQTLMTGEQRGLNVSSWPSQTYTNPQVLTFVTDNVEYLVGLGPCNQAGWSRNVQKKERSQQIVMKRSESFLLGVLPNRTHVVVGFHSVGEQAISTPAHVITENKRTRPELRR